MGGAVSRLRGALIQRPLQRWNAETRAEKVLSQEKPQPAPRYRNDADVLANLRQNHPELAKAAHKIDDGHLNRLKEVFVKSHDVENLEIKPARDPNRPLPQKQAPWLRLQEEEHPMIDPLLKEKEGKLLLRQVEQLLAKVQQDPKTYTAEFVAKQFGIKESHAQDLLKHYNVFSLFETKEGERPKDPLLPKPDWENAPPPPRPGLVPPKN